MSRRKSARILVPALVTAIALGLVSWAVAQSPPTQRLITAEGACAGEIPRAVMVWSMRTGNA